MPSREFAELELSAKHNIEKKDAVVDERNRADEDNFALRELKDGIAASSAPMVSTPAIRWLDQALEILCAHRSSVDNKYESLDAETSEIAREVVKNRNAAVEARERARGIDITSADSHSLRKLVDDQEANIQRSDKILGIMDRRHADFEAMLNIARYDYAVAERLSQSHFNGNDLTDFVGHTEGHVREVWEKMLDLRSVLGCVGFGDEDFFDSKTMDASVAFHDTRMSGGLSYSGTLFLGAFHADMVYKTRERHALESGIDLLSRRKELSSMGVNVNQAALMITLHSKRGFLEDGAVRDLTKGEFSDIKLAAMNFDDECRKRGIKWDISWMYKKGTCDFDDAVLKKTAASASVMRMADANRDGTRQYAQNGAKYIFKNEINARKTVDYKDKKDLENRMSEEVRDVYIGYDDDSGDVQNEFSRAVVFGEHNIDAMEIWPKEDGGIVYRFRINDPSLAIGCTAYAIQERLDEVKYSIFGKMRGTVEILSDKGPIRAIAECLRKINCGDNLGLPETWRLSTE
ncbi:MAG: hypothetical protein LBS53_01305 [Synergistaceae bacterium]|nr:hypothetical protein [Synergistaceae bacterium]